MKSLLGAWLTRAQTMLLLSPEANDAPREFLGEQRPIKIQADSVFLFSSESKYHTASISWDL
jgi:hypothetical protein